MSLLQALDGYYGRMAARGEAEPPGFSREKISFAVMLSPEGEPVRVRDLREASGKKQVPRLLAVPCLPGKRTVAVVSNLLWDKTAYALGRTAGEGRRTALEHAQFKSDNLALIAGSNDEGLIAFRRFLETWGPERFDSPPFDTGMLDANVVFALEGDTRYLHQRDAAIRLLEARAGADGPLQFCLVTGAEAPVARLHPAIRGVEGAQTAGAALVSFNLDAFTSYGKSQGDNAPTSEGAAFRYAQALNRMLDRGSRNRLRRPVGDATVVFWADAAEAEAQAAEDVFGLGVDPPDDAEQAAQVRRALEALAEGRPAQIEGRPVEPGVRFHVAGLSPNAARLSLRFWVSDTLEVFARRLAEHRQDLAVEPRPWRKDPSVNGLLVKTTALQEKFDNIPPLLAGEVTRAILTGGRYPQSWLAAVIGRLRAGDDPSTGWHAAAIRAVLARNARLDEKELPPVSLNRDSTDPAYVCGRLFAALESAQRGALGKVNATIRDRYMGAASATPASVFPLLLKNAQSHLGKMRKERKGGWIERELEDIQDKLDFSSDQGFPRSLKLEAQGGFFLGYYHQRKAQFAKAKEAGEEAEHTVDSTDQEGEGE